MDHPDCSNVLTRSDSKEKGKRNVSDTNNKNLHSLWKNSLYKTRTLIIHELRDSNTSSLLTDNNKSSLLMADLMGDNSWGRWDTSLLIPFDDCAASSINKAANRSKTAIALNQPII